MITPLKLKRMTLMIAPLVGCIAGLLSRPGEGRGGPEVFCVGFTEYQEAWGNIPTAGIPWQVATGVFGLSVAPGLLPVNCTGGLPFDQRPALQSYCRSARTWSDIPLPFVPIPGSNTLPVFPPPIVSGFRLTPNPTGFVAWLPSQADMDRCVRDGVNLVTAWQPVGFWAANGGAQAGAIATVHLSTNPTTPALIVEADIGLNTLTTVSGRPAWCFIESNDASQSNVVMHSTYSGTGPYPDPVIAYADLQGVMVHEFGHFAGLGHSLVDSRHQFGSDDIPTMIISGYGEPYSATLSLFDQATPCGIVNVSSNTAATEYGGLMGRNARSLEIDDIASIGSAYPTVAYNTQLGTIRGNCRLQNGGAGTPIAGVHIVAHRRDQIDRVRVGTYSRGNGDYVLSGLPPGEYYVFAEPVDQPPSIMGSSAGYFFNAFSIPNIVYQATFNLPSGLIGRGCLPNNSQPRFQTEYYDLQESFSEYGAMRADIVNLTVPGSQINGIDFLLVTNLLDDLTLHRGPFSSNRGSPRGVNISAPGGAYTPVELRIEASFAHRLLPYLLVLSTQRVEQPIAGQFLQPDMSTGLVVNGAFDNAGNATIPINLNASMAFTNYFIQAIAIHPTGLIELTNAPSLWISTR